MTQTPASLRQKKGLYASDVARELKTAKGNVSKFETGELRVTDEWIKRWAKVVGVRFAEARRAYWGIVLVRARKTMAEAKAQLRPRAGPGIRTDH